MENCGWAERIYQEKRKRPTDIRNEWERDYARIVHSSAFRRLQAKTQVLGLGDSDFYRTRLTHSMEVAQVGSGILRHLEVALDENGQGDLRRALPDQALMNSICLAHDLGHPPFGHGGEVALNICMRDFGGFEGNGQTLRILSKLEKYSESHGLNPTRRLLLGVLKYPASYSDLVQSHTYGELSQPPWLSSIDKQKPPKCYLDDEREVVKWVLKPFSEEERNQFKKKRHGKQHLKTAYKSLDTSIMDLADDISYSVHDLEDSIELRLISREVWETHFADKSSKKYFEDKSSDSFNDLTEKLFSGESYQLKKAIGGLVHLFISSIFMDESGMGDATSPLLKWNANMNSDAKCFLKDIFDLVNKTVIKSPNVQQLEFKGQKIIIELFKVLSSDPKRFLPDGTKNRYIKAESDKKKMRVICDFVAGMTNEYATRLYQRLYNPTKGSVFEVL